MTLKGEAKTAYMRDYMRRRRAGVVKPKHAGSDAQLQAENTALKARIVELEAALLKANTLNAEVGSTMRAFTAAHSAAKLDASKTESRAANWDPQGIARMSRTVRAILHPDAAPPQHKAWAHEVFVKVSAELERPVKRVKDRFAENEEMNCKRREVRERNSRRGKEAWAKRKAKAQQ